MASFRIGLLAASALAAAMLTACATNRHGGGIQIKKSTPAECKGKSDNACVLAVKVQAVGATGCKVKADLDDIALGPPVTGNSKRFVEWTLVDGAGNLATSEYAFVEDVGVYPLPGEDPDNAQFSKPKRTNAGTFRWQSNNMGRNPNPPVQVKYNFIVIRTTGTGQDQQIRLCDNIDPVIYNVD